MDSARLSAIRERYLEILTAGADLNTLCDCIAEDVGNPVSIHLPTRTIIARSASWTPDLVDDFLNSFALAEEQDVTVLFNRIIRKLKEGSPILDAFPYYRYQQMLSGCFRGGHLIAILDCAIVSRTSISDTSAILAAASPVVVTCMQLNGLADSITAHHMQVYLSALLLGQKEQIYQQIIHTGSAIAGTSRWQLLCLVPDQQSNLPSLKTEVESFCTRKEKYWCAQHEDAMVILMDSALSARLSYLQLEIQTGCRIAVSEPYDELLQTKQRYQQCRSALSLAEFEESEERIIFVHQYKVPIYILNYVTIHEEVDWKNTTIDDIKTHDLRNGTEYYQTIRAWLLCNRNYAKMAERLHVHKNTVNYRMQRLTELFDLDLTDTRTVTYLYVSLFSSFLPKRAL